MDVMNILEWIQSIVFFAIRQVTELQVTLVILINVTNMEAMEYIVFIVDLQVRAQLLILAIPINVMSYNHAKLDS